MIYVISMTLSQQSQDLYRTLLGSDQPLAAKELANKLRIFPASVYRLAEPLAAMGLITKSEKYPFQFSAKPLKEGFSLFLLHQSDWFWGQFANGNRKREGG